MQSLLFFLHRNWDPFPMNPSSSEKNQRASNIKNIFLSFANNWILFANQIRGYRHLHQISFLSRPIRELENPSHCRLESSSSTTPYLLGEKEQATPTSHFQTKSSIGQFFPYELPLRIEQSKTLRDHPLKKTIERLIEQGNWEELITLYRGHRNRQQFYDILFAHFLYSSKDDIDNLATAYIFLSCSDAVYTLIRPFQEIYLDHWDRLTIATIPPSKIHAIPLNLRYFIEIDISLMGQGQQELIQRIFDTNRKNYAIGCFHHIKEKNRFLVASSALMRIDTRLDGSLRFIHKMPRRSKVCEYLLKKEHVVSLFEPNDLLTTKIHGQTPFGPLAVMHDLFHAYVRAEKNLLENQEILKIALQITSLLTNLPRFVNLVAIDETRATRELNPFLCTTEEEVRFFLEEICQKIIDGEIENEVNPTPPEKILTNLMQRLTDTTGFYASKDFFIKAFSEKLEEIGFECYSEKNLLLIEKKLKIGSNMK